MNKVKFGMRNAVYSKITITNGVYTYGTPVVMPGVIGVTLGAVGETTDVYADDSLFFSLSSNGGYEGELETTLLPASFFKDILGQEEDGNGALIENADTLPSAFALGFEVSGDDKGYRNWFYHCTATRPNADAKTKGSSVEILSDKLTLKATPRTSDKNVKVTMLKSATNETAYNSFFTTVYEEETPSA